MFNIPALTAVAPEYVFEPDKTSLPAPSLLKPLDPETTPPSVNILALQVSILFIAVKFIPPVFCAKELVPVKVKSASMDIAFGTVTMPPLVLSRVFPLMVKIPLPKAPLLLMLMQPEEAFEKLTPPVKVFVPPKLRNPVLALVILNAPEILPFSAKVFADIVKVGATVKAIAPIFCVRL